MNSPVYEPYKTTDLICTVFILSIYTTTFTTFTTDWLHSSDGDKININDHS